MAAEITAVAALHTVETVSLPPTATRVVAAETGEHGAASQVGDLHPGVHTGSITSVVRIPVAMVGNVALELDVPPGVKPHGGINFIHPPGVNLGVVRVVAGPTIHKQTQVVLAPAIRVLNSSQPHAVVTSTADPDDAIAMRLEESTSSVEVATSCAVAAPATGVVAMAVAITRPNTGGPKPRPVPGAATAADTPAALRSAALRSALDVHGDVDLLAQKILDLLHHIANLPHSLGASAPVAPGELLLSLRQLRRALRGIARNLLHNTLMWSCVGRGDDNARDSE